MATLFQILQFFDSNGDPLAGGKLEWFQAGTSTPKNIFSNQGAGTPLPNPVILDSEGRIPDQSPYERGVWLSGSYKLVVKNSVNVINTTLDDINEYDSLDWTGLTASIADLNSTTTTALLKTTSYTVTVADRNKTILCDTTAGVIAINLPPAATAGNKFRIYVKKTDLGTNPVSIDPAGSETIDQASFFDLQSPFDCVEVQSDGSTWHTIARARRGWTNIITGTTSIGLRDYNRTLLASASGGAINIVLPAISTLGGSFRVKVKKIDGTTNAITLTPDGAETIDGDASLVLSSQWDVAEIVSLGGGNWYIVNDYQSALSFPLARDYIAGISIVQAADTAHDISFGIGECRDFANTVNMNLGSALIKQIDAQWSPGTNQGGFPSPDISLSSDTWYHLFIIQNAGGTTDAGFDSDINAVNLLNNSGYTKYRRVGSVRTDGSNNITDFYMKNFEGFRDYYWKTPVKDLDINYTSSATYTGTFTLTVPIDIEVIAKINILVNAAGGDQIEARFHYVSQNNNISLSSGFAQLYTKDDNWSGSFMEIRTDISSQIDYAAIVGGADATLISATEGWIDNLSTL